LVSSPQYAARALSVLLLVLAGCGSATTLAGPSSALPTSTPWSTPTLGPTAIPWPTTAAPTSTPAPQWLTHVEALHDPGARTYRIDVPGVLECSLSSAPPEHDILPCNYPSGAQLPPQHPLAAEVAIALDAAWVSDQWFPCRDGRRIVVGPGITAYESDNLTLTAAGNCFEPPFAPEIRAFWVAGGVCYQLRMEGNSPAQTFLARYGAIWRHMLASFVPAPAASSGAACA
jgi:hypothetical protein